MDGIKQDFSWANWAYGFACGLLTAAIIGLVISVSI